MNEDKILKKLIRKEDVTLSDKDAAEMLYDICDREHSGCSEICPIYKQILIKEQKLNADCPYFKNGQMMLEALRGDKTHKIVIDAKKYIVKDKEFLAIAKILDIKILSYMDV